MSLIQGAYCADKQKIPEKLQVALFYKLLPFNQNLKGNISIYVIGNKKIAKEFHAVLNKKIGSSTLVEITSGSELPKKAPHIIYIDSQVKNKATILKYCHKNGVMSICADSDTVRLGACLGLTINNNGRAKILISQKGTKKEKINWKSTILKMADVIRE